MGEKCWYLVCEDGFIRSVCGLHALLRLGGLSGAATGKRVWGLLWMWWRNGMGLRGLVVETTGQRSRWVDVVVLIGRGMAVMARVMNHRPSHRRSCCRVGGSALPDPFCGSGLGGGV